MKLLICAGGTGGGIYPALAVVSELERRGLRRKTDVLWIGTQGEMEETLVPREGIQLATIRGGAIAGVPLKDKMAHAAQLAGSIPTAWRHIRRFQPDVMFMTGGYMAAPVAFSAWAQRVPIGIYLPDVEPGASIRSTLPLARKIACTTAGSRAYVPQDKMLVTGYPVRPELRAATTLSQAETLAAFDLTPERQTLFVFGGSRGAQTINRALMGALPGLLAQIQVIHLSGTQTWPEVEANLASLSSAQRRWYRPFPYLHDEMGAAFRAADLVLARAGASMLGEGPAFGLPAVLVPLAWAWRYQKVNADYLQERGAAVQLTDETLAEQLAPTVLDILQDMRRLDAMRTAATALDIPNATANLADMLTQLGSEVPS